MTNEYMTVQIPKLQTPLRLFFIDNLSIGQVKQMKTNEIIRPHIESAIWIPCYAHITSDGYTLFDEKGDPFYCHTNDPQVANSPNRTYQHKEKLQSAIDASIENLQTALTRIAPNVKFDRNMTIYADKGRLKTMHPIQYCMDHTTNEMVLCCIDNNTGAIEHITTRDIGKTAWLNPPEAFERQERTKKIRKIKTTVENLSNDQLNKLETLLKNFPS